MSRYNLRHTGNKRVSEARIRCYAIVMENAVLIAGPQLRRFELAHIKRCAYATKVDPIQECYRPPVHIHELGNSLD